MSSFLSKEKQTILQAFFDEYEWIHLTLGMLGNFMFFAGSVFFLWEVTKFAGIWLFIIGSFFMLIGSIGSGLVKHLDNQKNKS